jgi:mono/diheme cytochrome c family protein
MTEADRQKNQELAKADRQAIFKNDCASCHSEKGKGLFGAALYKADCAICHDAEHRASFVPDIAALNRPPDTNYWLTTIAKGVEKPGSLMPAFAQEHGGPLTKEQVDSLVAYMITDYPKDHKPTAHDHKADAPSHPEAAPQPSKPQATAAPGLPPSPPAIPGQQPATTTPTVQPVKK